VVIFSPYVLSFVIAIYVIQSVGLYSRASDGLFEQAFAINIQESNIQDEKR